MSSDIHFLREIRSTKRKGYLRVYSTGSYSLVWSYKANQKCTVWRPNFEDKTFFWLGDHAQGDDNRATGISELVQPVDDDPNDPMLKYVEHWNWNRMWLKEQKNYPHPSIWSPTPPEGYVPLGWVGGDGDYPPIVEGFVCVRFDFDLVTESSTGAAIWDDKGSKAKQNITLWSIKGVPNGFVGQGNYLPYSGTVYKLKGS